MQILASRESIVPVPRDVKYSNHILYDVKCIDIPGRKSSGHQDVEKCILLLKSGRVSISLTSRRASTMFESQSEQHREVPRSNEPVAELHNPPNFFRLPELRKFSLVGRLPVQMGTQNYVRTEFAQDFVDCTSRLTYVRCCSHANYRAGQGSEISTHNGR